MSDGGETAEETAAGTPAEVDADDDSGWGDDEAATGTDGDSGVDVDTVVEYLLWGGLVGLGILAVIATAGLYGSLSAIIDVWVATRYQPFARSALNFAVLCAAGAGIVLLSRRLRRSGR
jgi:hypothetical protein